MHVADLLSRSYLDETESDDNYMYELIHCVGLSSYLQCTDKQKQELMSETCKDEEILRLLSYVKDG